MTNMWTKWDRRFMELARLVSTWSKDPSTKVGAVVVDSQKRIKSVGYNGFPKATDDSPELYLDRETKYRRTVHAEANAILTGSDLTGCTVYTYPFMPCPHCAGLIIQSGIARVISLDYCPERWAVDFRESDKLFREAGVEVFLYDNYSL